MTKVSKKYVIQDKDQNVVSEPLAPLYLNNPAFNFWNSIVSGIVTPINKMTSFEKMTLLDKGINKNDLEQFKLKAQLDYDKLAQALAVTRATLISKKKNEAYSDGVSEKILALTDLYSYGYEVFEDVDNFNSWMFVSNKALAGKTPFDIIDNQFGREEVKNIIGRIEYGIYS
jgi:putative toxin-antitoxin system antitoxin component (TIGR02293 family)